MSSRQDQLDAYRYQTQRMVGALVAHDPDPARSPMRHTGSAVLVSLLVAVISVGGVAAYQLFKEQSSLKDLRTEGMVFIEKETGAQYVYTKADDRLHPVVNYTSGLLIAGSDTPQSKIVSRSRLTTVQRRTGLQLGATLGIPGAPKSLPSSSSLIHDPWQVCSGSAGAGRPRRTVLTVGGAGAVGGRTLTAVDRGAVGEGLLAADPAGTEYLIYGNHKFLIQKPKVFRVAFGWTELPVTVTAALLNTIPSGPDIEALHVAGRGTRSAAGNGTIGRLYRTPGPGQSTLWGVLRRDGLLPITDVQAKLLQADRAAKVGAPVSVSTAEFGTLLPAGKSLVLSEQDDLLPSVVPAQVTADDSVCVTVTDAVKGVTAVVVDPDVSDGPATAAEPDPSAGQRDVRAPTATRVSVPFGRGVLVEPSPPGTPPGANVPTIVTDTGVRFPIVDRTALAKLGYDKAVPVRMPPEVVALIPAGVALDPQVALTSRP